MSSLFVSDDPIRTEPSRESSQSYCHSFRLFAPHLILMVKKTVDEAMKKLSFRRIANAFNGSIAPVIGFSVLASASDFPKLVQLACKTNVASTVTRFCTYEAILNSQRSIATVIDIEFADLNNLLSLFTI
jgi:hypothetical protein